MENMVKLSYVPEGHNLFIVLEGANDYCHSPTKNKHLLKLETWSEEGKGFRVCGYIVKLQHDLTPGEYTLKSLEFSEDISDELKAFFGLLCDIEDYVSLSLTVK